jgi:hypothetical protein
MAKTPIDKFSEAISDMLAEYGDELRENISEAVKTVSKKGAQAVKQSARQTFGGSGAYAKGWTSRAETGRFSAQGFIYNKDLPGLPHLLEHGHAKRNGGRVPGREHIAPVESEIVKEFEKAVKESV